MEIKANNSDVKVTQDYLLFTGLQNFRVLGFNLTKDQLIALGQNPQKEPEYKGVIINNDTYNKIVVHLVNDEFSIRTRVEFLVQPKIQTNKDATKTKYIGIKGKNKNEIQSSLNTDVDALKEFSEKWPTLIDYKTCRPAFVGEVNIVEFIYNWLNINQEDGVFLDDFEEMANGDVSGLNALATAYSTNEVKVLLGVTGKDNKFYPAVYNQMFLRKTDTDFKLLSDKLKDQYGKFKADYQNSLDFKQFTPKYDVGVPDANTQATPAKSLFA